VIHRGKIVEERIIDSGRKLGFVFEKLRITRPTLRKWLDTPDLEFDKIIKIGKIINYDFSNDFKDIKKYLVAEDPAPYYANSSLKDCIIEKEKFRSEADMYRDLYIQTISDLLKTKDQLIEALQK
jgi:hypothetical protein